MPASFSWPATTAILSAIATCLCLVLDFKFQSKGIDLVRVQYTISYGVIQLPTAYCLKDYIFLLDKALLLPVLVVYNYPRHGKLFSQPQGANKVK